MKKIITSLVIAISMFTSVTEAFAVRQKPVVEGRVLDENGSPVEYATVVLLRSMMPQATEAEQVLQAAGAEQELPPADQQQTASFEQAAGGVSDAGGRFELSAPAGNYRLRVMCMGYEDTEIEIELIGSLQLPDISLTSAMEQIETLRVTGRAIVREADRFVVTVANTVGAVGKDAFELLKTSPSVWVNGNDITINGRSGTRVMIGDRLLRMTGDDLEAYLRSIKAEDILRIEIIPDAGAEYDADSAGGIIKITLAKRRNDGIDGNVAISGSTLLKGKSNILSPSAGLNYQSGKLNLYGNVNYTYYDSTTPMEETTVMSHHSLGEITTLNNAKVNMGGNYYGGRLGGIYDIDSLSSVGAEFSINHSGAGGGTDSRTNTVMPEMGYDTENIYDSDRSANSYAGTVNYIRKFGKLGSTFKLIGDWAASRDHSHNYNRETYIVAGVPPRDTLGRLNSESRYNVYSLNANLDLVRSATTVMKMGAKYTYNDIYSPIMAEGMAEGDTGWTFSELQSSITDYSENIGALYFIYNSRFGKLGLSAGLRAEYSYMNSRFRENYGDPNPKEQTNSYFDLFPNLNLSMPLNETYSNSLVLSYSRNIQRPHFMYLSPFRTQLSPNSYVSGNPDLKPTYANNISLTGVLAYKYTVTLGASINQNQIRQEIITEDGNDNMLVYKYMNIPSTMQFYAQVNAPVTIMERWTANLNFTGIYMNQKLNESDPYKGRFTALANLSTNIEIPKWFDIEFTYSYMSKFLNANMEIMPMHYLNAAIKKRFADNKFTLSLNVSNILSSYQKLHSFGGDQAGWMFDKWTYQGKGNGPMVTLSLRYNFNAGVKFRARTVEKSASDDIGRMTSGEN